MADWKIDEGVGKDRSIENPYRNVRTYYCPLENILETENYLSIIGNNGGNNVEIRVPIEELVAAGWRAPEKPLADRHAEQAMAEIAESIEAEKSIGMDAD